MPKNQVSKSQGVKISFSAIKICDEINGLLIARYLDYINPAIHIYFILENWTRIFLICLESLNAVHGFSPKLMEWHSHGCDCTAPFSLDKGHAALHTNKERTLGCARSIASEIRSQQTHQSPSVKLMLIASGWRWWCSNHSPGGSIIYICHFKYYFKWSPSHPSSMWVQYSATQPKAKSYIIINIPI